MNKLIWEERKREILKEQLKQGEKDKNLIKSSKVKKEKVKNLKNFDVGIFLFLFVVYKRNSFV